MRIERLRATHLRCFADVELQPGPGVNWLVGPNGAGKTTLLEAAYLLSHGRSFRQGGRGAPRQHGAPGYVIHADIRDRNGVGVRLGLERSADRWAARRNGVDLASLAPLFEACPVVYFGPESQALLLGPAEERRSFLDWSVFHVEHDSLLLWRSWRRALRQRNALLRQGAPAANFEPWEHDLGELAQRIDGARRRCLASLEPFFLAEAAHLVPELGSVRVEYRPGWDTDVGLAAQLAATRERDRERGYTSHGAHRGDWALLFAGVAQREHLSRGQAKAAALVCTLGLTLWLNETTGAYPLLCLDDLASELDAPHAAKVIDWLQGRPIQSWLTSVRSMDHGTLRPGSCVFHVKHSGCERAG